MAGGTEWLVKILEDQYSRRFRGKFSTPTHVSTVHNGGVARPKNKGMAIAHGK